MLIYVNGDSQTDGIGLGDSSVFPEYPGNMMNINWDIINPWASLRAHLTESRDLADTLKQENRKRCWATHLGNLYSAEVINEAVGGSTMFGILTRTIHDIDNLIKKNKIPDLVLIGLTTEERIPIINDRPNIHDDSDWIHTLHPMSIDHADPVHQKYAKEYWISNTDEAILTFFLYQCLHIKHYVNAKLGIDPIFLHTSPYFYKNFKIINYTNIHLLREAWDLLKFNDVHEQKSFFNVAHQDGFTACAHFVEPGHIRYAKYVAEEILKI